MKSIVLEELTMFPSCNKRLFHFQTHLRCGDDFSGIHKSVSQRQDTVCYLNRQSFQEAVAHSTTIYLPLTTASYFLLWHTYVVQLYFHILTKQTSPWLEHYDLLDPSVLYSASTTGQAPHGRKTAQRLWGVLNMF